MNSLEGSTCIITGANSGIGKAAAEEIARMGVRVVMVCRNREKGRQALVEICHSSGSSAVDLLIADMSSPDDIQRVATEIATKYPQIDILINNAGLLNRRRELTDEGLEATFAVNHLGYFRFTNLLLPTLRKSAPARIVNVSSDAHKGQTLDFDDLHAEKKYRGFRQYGRSKLANLLFTYELARRLEGTGITVNAMHPGVVRTAFGRSGRGLMTLFYRLSGKFLRTPEHGARTVIHLATSPEVDGINGRYFKDETVAESSKESLDVDAAKRLWEISSELSQV